jgi:KDO2-lipid IV(A) lauroyltransferase
MCGALLGAIAWKGIGRRRRRTIDNLAAAFPEWSEAEHVRVARASFGHLGTSIAEMLHIRRRSPAEASSHVTVEGFEEVERIRAGGRPILIVTAHCGNWELLATANHSHGLALAAMVRELESSAVNQLALALRAHLGSEIIVRGDSSSPRKLLKTLRSGGTLALLIDQDIETEGVFVPFFGRLAFTTVAVSSLADRLGAEVVPAFCERNEDGSHLLRFHPAVELPEDPEAATALLTARIEEQIRHRPEQWVWLHRRWRRRPAEELGQATGG